jgi:hypothetical protein
MYSPRLKNSSYPGDRTEYSSYREADACSQCKARGLATGCKPQYDPQDAPSPEPDIDLRDRVARLESALMSLTGRSSPGEVNRSNPHNYSNNVGTAVASGTDAACITHHPSYYPSPDDSLINPALYSVFSSTNVFDCSHLHHLMLRHRLHRIPTMSLPINPSLIHLSVWIQCQLVNGSRTISPQFLNSQIHPCPHHPVHRIPPPATSRVDQQDTPKIVAVPTKRNYYQTSQRRSSSMNSSPSIFPEQMSATPLSVQYSINRTINYGIPLLINLSTSPFLECYSSQWQMQYIVIPTLMERIVNKQEPQWICMIVYQIKSQKTLDIISTSKQSKQPFFKECFSSTMSLPTSPNADYREK